MPFKSFLNSKIIVQLCSIGVFTVFGLNIANNQASGKNEFEVTQVEINDRNYSLEIARSTSQRQQGLMFRESLSTDAGMLFLYPSPGYHRIWMKNTLIPLTVIWLDSNETVIGIEKLFPCESDSCPSYGVSKLSSYVLELDAENSALDIGDQVPILRSLRK